MKVLLANPPCKESLNRYYEKYFIRAGSRWPHSGIKRKSQLPHYLPFPFFLAYAAALLRNDGFEVEVIDAVALDISLQLFKDMVMEIKPDVILFETTTPTIDYDIALIREIKAKIDTQIVLTGTHASTFGVLLMREVKEIDYILFGEYEFTFLDLSSRISQNKSLDDVKGVIYRNKDEIISTERAPLIDPLDTLPFPARDIFPSNKNPNAKIYWDGFCQNWPVIKMHASRGCPYSCSFCVWNQVIYGNGKYRTFSPARVVDEMEYVIKEYAAKEIYFDDDDFTINRKQVHAICQQIKERNINVKWSCMGDAINLDEETIRLMASCGCVGIKFGVESGSKQVLRQLGKPVDLEKVVRIDDLCYKYGIKSHATFTIGLLGETRHSLEETHKFVKKLNSSSIQVSICTPFPGTRFYEEVKSKGFFKDSSWDQFDGKAKETINYPGLSAKEMEEFRRIIFRSWFLNKLINPLWLFRQMKILLRTMRGLGLRFFVTQVVTVLEDEWRCRKS